MFDDAVVSTPLVEKLSLMAQGIPLSTLSVTSLSLTSSKIVTKLFISSCEACALFNASFVSSLLVTLPSFKAVCISTKLLSK